MPSLPEAAVLPLSVGPGGVRLQVRVAPRASADAIRGLHREADGSVSLKVSVTAPASDGKANAALIRLIAKAWKLEKSSLSLASGDTSRRKSVRIAGDADVLSARLRRHLEAVAPPREP